MKTMFGARGAPAAQIADSGAASTAATRKTVCFTVVTS